MNHNRGFGESLSICADCSSWYGKQRYLMEPATCDRCWKERVQAKLNGSKKHLREQGAETKDAKTDI